MHMRMHMRRYEMAHMVYHLEHTKLQYIDLNQSHMLKGGDLVSLKQTY